MLDDPQQSGRVVPGGKPPSGSPVDPLRPLRRLAAVAGAGWLLALGLLWGQHQMRVLHPPSLLFLGLLALALGATLAALGCGLWRVLQGPKRPRTLAWLGVALLPALGGAALGLYAHHNGRRGHAPHNPPMILMTRFGHSLMEAEALYLYPRRLESQRLVMFYDEQVADPQADLDAMDRHVAGMEELLGLPLRAKIYWARGPLLGRRGLCCHGIVMGSERSPAAGLDRHELAHAVVYQHHAADTDPPTLLSEGWAESQSAEPRELAERALDLRRVLEAWRQLPEAEAGQALRTLMHPEQYEGLMRKARAGGRMPSWLREFTDDSWYHQDRGPVYPVGGVFTNFLLRRYGVGRFRELYFGCRPGRFEAECRQLLGADLDALEQAAWEDAEQLTRDPNRPPRP